MSTTSCQRVIEAELKARVCHRDGLIAHLEQRALGEATTYCDTYYDTLGRTFDGHRSGAAGTGHRA